MSLAAPLVAQELLDPTRPAVSLESASGVAAVQAASEADGAQGLSLIMIQPNRRAAVIDGRVIELNGRYGKFKLLEVNEDYVVLQSADGPRVMRLFPAVNMTVASRSPAMKASEPIKAGTRHAAPVTPVKEKK